MSSSLRSELIEMQTRLAQVIAQLPDDEKPGKKPRRRGPRIVDSSTLPGPKANEIERAAARRLVRGAR